MKLLELIKNLETIETVGNLNIDVKDIKIDSNTVSDGCLFIALRGREFDGHSFVRQVENYGGVAIVTEKKVSTTLTQIIVKDTRKAMSKLAKSFYGNPDKSLKLIGVVGTNGKTTTSHLIKNIITESGLKCGVIGTLGTFYDDVFIEPTLTTPDPLILYKTFYDMKKAGVKYVVMEVSAHALALKKVEDLYFEVGVFTNFSQDHLDFFGDMENYKKTKMSFFDAKKCKYIVVNSDDDFGLEVYKKQLGVITYGIENPADVFAINLNESIDNTEYVLNLFDCVYNVNTKLIGRFNVYNELAASATCALLGLKTEKIIQAIDNVSGISGRLEKLEHNGIKVFIDYAHTPDGIKKTLTALKNVAKNKLICVIGCGGNRDEKKRMPMGNICGELADFTVITSDNPRYEEPMDRINEIETGVLKSTKKYIIVQDRIEAIKYALTMAKCGDIVLIAGKGSEKYQEVLGIKHLYNDKDTVKEIFKKIKN